MNLVATTGDLPLCGCVVWVQCTMWYGYNGPGSKVSTCLSFKTKAKWFEGLHRSDLLHWAQAITHSVAVCRRDGKSFKLLKGVWYGIMAKFHDFQVKARVWSSAVLLDRLLLVQMN